MKDTAGYAKIVEWRKSSMQCGECTRIGIWSHGDDGRTFFEQL